MNQKSIVLTLGALLGLFPIGLMFCHAPQASDALGKLAFGTLTALAAYLQTDHMP